MKIKSIISTMIMAAAFSTAMFSSFSAFSDCAKQGDVCTSDKYCSKNQGLRCMQTKGSKDKHCEYTS